jgi:hypothetical protein
MTDFYDPKRPVTLTEGVVFFAIFVALPVMIFMRPEMFRHDVGTLGLFCIVLLMCLLGSPSVIRSFVLKRRGLPLVRIDERGIWSRLWSPLIGWIEWDDIECAILKQTRYSEFLVLQLKKDKLAGLPWNMRVAEVIKVVLSMLSFTNESRYRIGIAGKLSLGDRWNELISTLEPLLIAHGVPRRQQKAGNFGSLSE